MKPFQAKRSFIGISIGYFILEVGRYIVKGQFNFYEMLIRDVSAAVALGIIFMAYKYMKTP